MALELPKRAALLAGFAKALELLKTVGHTSTNLASRSETRVDEHHAIVLAQFVWRVERAARPIDVTVDSTFIPHMKDGLAEIVFHHEHEDFWQALQTHGVLPPQ